MFETGWREQAWARAGEPWDLIVIGGGITGAGILRMAAGAGLKCLLLEGADFSAGTSSRSSKLVHGGFRYLYNRQFQVTHESVREREWLCKAASGLVQPLPFVLPNYQRYNKSSWEFHLGVIFYDLMALKWKHRLLSPEDVARQLPQIRPQGLLGAYEYWDAVVDDSHLVQRLVEEAVVLGGLAVNYARVTSLLKNRNSRVCGVSVKDLSGDSSAQVEIHASVVVNAAGPWTDDLRSFIARQPRLRKQRGSHLVFPYHRLPLVKAVTYFHPRDRRAQFAIPWEGVTLIGTTDLDHDPAADESCGEPYASAAEIDYLLEGARELFPSCGLVQEDITSTFSGVRPVIKSGADSPSKESRAHGLWEEDGLITITGGKLTTFRLMAAQTMTCILQQLEKPLRLDSTNIFSPVTQPSLNGKPSISNKRFGRYSQTAADWIAQSNAKEVEAIPGTPYCWAELRQAARGGGVVHLDDLLLRRLRLGLLCKAGGTGFFPQIREICLHELNWEEQKWQVELHRYQSIWSAAYSPDPGKQVEIGHEPSEIAYSR